ncbi:MAG: hypothetical protein ACHREM_24100 [Polyangiales bacterium]
MRSSKDVESYLMRMGRPFEVIAGEGEVTEATTWITHTSGVPVALILQVPLVVARVEIGKLPAAGTKAREPLFEHLLRLNATSLVHACYGLDGETIVLTATAELENLDYNELDAVFIDIDLALAQHLPRIRELANAA